MPNGDDGFVLDDTDIASMIHSSDEEATVIAKLENPGRKLFLSLLLKRLLPNDTVLQFLIYDFIRSP